LERDDFRAHAGSYAFFTGGVPRECGCGLERDERNGGGSPHDVEEKGDYPIMGLKSVVKNVGVREYGVGVAERLDRSKCNK